MYNKERRRRKGQRKEERRLQLRRNDKSKFNNLTILMCVYCSL